MRSLVKTWFDLSGLLWQWLWRKIRPVFWLLLLALLLGGSSLPPDDRTERIRFYTRQIEFDYIAWTVDALGLKLGQAALGSQGYLEPQAGPQFVLEYIELMRQIHQQQNEINLIFTDPAVSDPLAESAALRAGLADLTARRRDLEPLAETILQSQLSRIAADLDLTIAGQPLPPVLYHTTPPPYALIISPRDLIRHDESISISPELPLERQVALEDDVAQALDVSTLVVGIGGIGLYPTMVMETTSLEWLAEVVAHEWIHNHLNLLPLGLSYMNSPELRIMNETTAAIAGKEMGRALIERYYPQLLPQPQPAQAASPSEVPQPIEPAPPEFNFNAEMRLTRVEAEALLAAGKIKAAEDYMEERRRLFWQQGYRIRKLNQAYFAFYGAYADQPGGAAGADPVGEAVRSLRANSPSLAAFISRIGRMWTFEQLQQAVAP